MEIKNKWPLYSILLFVFLVAVLGINYGLPLQLVDDEPPFILGALKMIQLKTVLPVLHQEEFRPFLYYPPYLSYLYLPIFLIIAAAQFLFFAGTQQEFLHYIASDTSLFFLAARFLVVLLGIFSVFLIYKVSERLFRNRLAALFSAFFLGTSLSYLALSMTSRHWLPVSFFFVLTLFFLTQPNWSFRKRYFLAILTLGIGSGVSSVTIIGFSIVFFWYLFYERRSFYKALKDPFSYVLLLIFAVLLVIPGLIYPLSFGYKGAITILEAKSILGLVASPIAFLKPIIISEPILTLFAFLGLIFAIRKKELFAWPLLLYVGLYGVVFYLFFRYTHRFAVPLIPFLALFAGYGFGAFFQKTSNTFIKAVLVLTLFVPIVISAQLGYLAYQNDSRILARQWVEANIPEGSKILVISPLLRLASTKEAIEEQRLIDPASIRKVDEAEAFFDGNSRYQSFHALNLYTIQRVAFYDRVVEYIKKHRYEYIIITPQEGFVKKYYEALKSVLHKEATLIQSFGNPQGIYTLSGSEFRGSPLGFWQLKEFGPQVLIYELQ